MNCYKCDCIIVDAVSDTIPLCQTCYQKLTPGELVIITPINCTECGKDVSNPSERVPGKVEPMCRHCFNRGFLPLSTTQPSPIPDFCAQPESGLCDCGYDDKDARQIVGSVNAAIIRNTKCTRDGFFSSNEAMADFNFWLDYAKGNA